jgi:hypothetical protein
MESLVKSIRIDRELALPDNSQWENRFEVKSSSSGNVYTISQNKKKRFWACDCPGWKRYRKCKHLQELGLPVNERPHEVNIVRR